MTSNDAVDASSSLASSGDDGAAVCYLCLGGGVDDNDGQQVRRDCACRGTDAGFIHLECLADYAETKSMQTRGDMDEFVKPWAACPGCHQNYQNELAIDIANKFASFVRRQYPDDTQRQVESLNVKMAALKSMFWKLQPLQKREAEDTANVLLSLINQMKNDAPLTYRYSQYEANAYYIHGTIAFDEGTEESARRAVIHFENQLELNASIGYDDGVATAKTCIALAKSKYKGGINNEEVLKASQEVYELRIAELGEESEYTIRAGEDYAIELQRANRCDEARELLMKLLATSKQVLGSDHCTTKAVASTLAS